MGSVRAGQAYIELTTRDGELQKGLARAAARMKEFGAACTQVGRELLTFSTSVAVPFALAVNAFKNFDSQMRIVKAVTRATGKEFDMLTAKARQLGRDTDFTAQQTAGAMVNLGRAGFKPEEINRAIEPVMNLARATDTDLPEAAEIAVNSLRIFQLEAGKMAYVTDILTVGANGSAQTVTDLFEALKIAGPQAQSAGEDIKDVTAALGVMANVGIRGSLAGTSLRKAYLQFADPKIQNFLKDYGIKTVDNTGNLRKMRDIMIDLSGVMSGMGSAERLSFAKEVFDLRGMTGGLSITADKSKIDEFIRALDQSTDAAARTRKEIESGLSNSFNKFLSAVESLGIALGEELASEITSVLKILTEAAKHIESWVKENKTFITGLAALIGTLAMAGAALLALGGAIKMVAGVITFCSAGLKMFGTALKAVMALKALYIGMLTSWTAAITAFSGAVALGTSTITAFGVAIKAFLATNPVGWCMLAVGALLALAAAFSDVGNNVEKTSNRIAEANGKNKDKRDADRDKATELAELQNKKNLTPAEEARKKLLEKELQDEYGSTDINAINAKEIEELDKQIKEHEKNIEAAKKANKTWDFGFKDILNLGYNYWSGERADALSKNTKYIAAQHYKKAQAMARRYKLQQKGEASKGDPNPVSAKEYIDALKVMREYDQKAEQAKKSDIEKEIEKVNAEADAYNANAEKAILRLQHELVKEKDPAKQENLQKRIRDIQQKNEAVQSSRKANISGIRSRYSSAAKERVSDIRDRFSAASADAEEKRKRAKEDKAIDKKIKTSPEDAIAYLVNQLTQMKEAVVLAEQEFNMAVSDAELPDSDGVTRLTKEEEKRIAAAEKKYNNLQARIENYQSRLETARERLSGSKSLLGSFSLKELAGQLGGNSAAERTAKASEEQVRWQKKIYKNLNEKGNLRWK